MPLLTTFALWVHWIMSISFSWKMVPKFTIQIVNPILGHCLYISHLLIQLIHQCAICQLPVCRCSFQFIHFSVRYLFSISYCIRCLVLFYCSDLVDYHVKRWNLPYVVPIFTQVMAVVLEAKWKNTFWIYFSLEDKLQKVWWRRKRHPVPPEQQSPKQIRIELIKELCIDNFEH